MVESLNKKDIFEADHKVMVVIASPGEPYLKSVLDDAKRSVKFAERYGFKVHQFIDGDAKQSALNLFFNSQEKACIEHASKKNKGKFFFVVYYSGHGSSANQNTEVIIKDDENNFVRYPLAVKVRNFRNNNPKNAFVFAVFDCCRNDPKLKRGSELIVQDIAKGDQDEEYEEYQAGDANLVIVSSCVPTKVTNVSDRFTFALFEFLEKNESKDTK